MPLSPSLRRQLEALLRAYDRGSGPVEQEARRRLAAGLPMTAMQIRAFAEACYPVELRDFLGALAHKRLYEADLGQALAVSVASASAPTSREPRPPPVDRPANRVTKGPTGWARIIVLALAVLAGGLILAGVFTRPPRERDLPDAPAADLQRSPARVVTPEESVCLSLLRASATDWCETALTGIPARGPLYPDEPGSCGERLTAGRDTVRLALDGLLEDEATDTYTPQDARRRCAAAAEVAVPR